MDEQRLIAVAALMHDIGKFMQRGFSESRQEYSHPELSEIFFSDVSEVKYTESKEFVSALSFLTGHHHEKDIDKSGGSGLLRLFAEIISEADNISSAERKGAEEGKLQMLKPILSSIDIGKGSSDGNYYFDLKPLSFENEGVILPKKGSITEKQMEEQYKAHWKNFFEEYKNVVKKLSPDTLYYVLEKYLWCVPSAYYRSVPDISLFEHSKVTAAIATSMYRALKEIHPELFKDGFPPSEMRKIVKDRKEERYLFTAIDVNGIQKFIYSISSKKALKSLKGRSLYVEFLSSLILHKILWDKDINLYEANVIYSGGGKAYVLLPITAQKRVNELRSEIEEMLFDEFGDRISVTIATIPVSAEALSKDKISDTWELLGTRLTEERQKKFAGIISKNYSEFFEPRESGGFFDESGKGDKRVICPICRKEVPESETKPLKGEEDIKVCRECNTFIEIGNKTDSNKLFAIIGNGVSNDRALEITVKGFKLKIFFANSPYDVQTEGRTLLLNMSGTDLYGNEKTDVGFMPNVTVKPPVNELHEFTERSKGISRIGVLRMDIDNLGSIFMKGLPEKMSTLSRKSQLSSAISLFFKGRIKEIVSESFKKSIYVIYAGGDDLFALGEWDAIPEFASIVRDEFTEYACNNPSLTISGGIFLIKDKYPISRGARFAGDMEEMAKEYAYKGHTKDALSFLGKALSWNDLNVARILKEALVKYYEEKNDKSVIWKLKKIYSLYELAEEKYKNKETLSEEEVAEKAKWSKWMWMLAYYIGRSNNKRLNSIGDALINDMIKDKNIKSEKPIISYLDVPTNWADLTIRR